MTKYVLGFMFNRAKNYVLLIEKKKPKWQLGKLNGVGGKVEQGENYLQAMVREFKEETGIDYKFWKPVIKMVGDDWEVQVFTASTDEVHNFKTIEEERLIFIDVSELDYYDHISNLQWLIPMCLDASRIDYTISSK